MSCRRAGKSATSDILDEVKILQDMGLLISTIVVLLIVLIGKLIF